MRSSTPHLMLALCSMAVQAAPISPAPKTPDMLTVMARGEVDARDTNNNLDVNDYRRRSTSGFSNEKYETNVQNTNVRRSIGGYSYPAGTNAVGRRDEMPTTPGLTTRAPINNSNADSGSDSDSALNSDSDSGFDSDSDDDDFQGQDHFSRMEVRDAPTDQDAAAVDDIFSNDMFDADAEDGLEDFDSDSDFDGDDLQARHAEIKRSIDALLQEDYALERRHQNPSPSKDNVARDFDSDSASDSDDYDSESDSDSDGEFYRNSQTSASGVPKSNASKAGAPVVASVAADKQKDSLELSADGSQGGEYRAQVEDAEPEASAKLEMI